MGAVHPSHLLAAFNVMLRQLFSAVGKVSDDGIHSTVHYEQVMALVEEKQVWDLLDKHVMFVTNKLFIYNEMLTAPTSFDILRYQLLMLIQETDEIRASTAAYQYILDRTRLSRSSIMKMLAELKKGNYIQLENGKLIAIHHLPNRF